MLKVLKPAYGLVEGVGGALRRWAWPLVAFWLAREKKEEKRRRAENERT